MNLIRSSRLVHRVALAAAAGVPLLAVGGCWGPGGRLYSGDLYTYESHSFQPWTITLTDTRTGEAVWAMDVPVGQQLCIQFYEEDGDDLPNGDPSPVYPDRMKWQLMPRGTKLGELHNFVMVPAAVHRRIDSKLRKVPELPPEMTGESGAAPAGEGAK